MNYLIGSPNWDQVPQIETNTPLKGGPTGALNGQAQALANRVEWLQRRTADVLYSSKHGVVGDGVTDATAKAQELIDLADASGLEIVWEGAVLCGRLSSASSVRWRGARGARFIMKPGIYEPGSFHITLTGQDVHLENIEQDGNQWAMAFGQGGGGLRITGPSPTLMGVKVRNYPATAYETYSDSTGRKRGLHIGCNFDDNAGLGLQSYAAAYMDFFDCSFNRNGYGFQKTRANPADSSHSFLAFGTAFRMRSHHINLTNCQALDNGRDGFNVNQGSYAFNFGQCNASGNDDGGFTIASDNTGSGLPGEGEKCHDLQYIDCEGANNYTSGLVAYQPVQNLTVHGGHYFNNHRVAGKQATQASYRCGIYIAGGSTGIKIDTKAYDDRQTRRITAALGDVLTATGWVAGSMLQFPRVAILSGVDMSFKGYANITAEAAGTVTVVATAANGVALGAIVAGDLVSQCVQHNGVFIDNNCKGQVKVEAWGEKKGPSDSGYKVFSGAYSYGQNITVAGMYGNELMLNPGFDIDTAGWAFDFPGGGSVARVTTTTRSSGALQMVAGSSNANADGPLVADALKQAAGGFVEFGMWCYASGPNDALLYLFFNPGGPLYDTSVKHPGGGWRYLRIGIFLPAGSTSIFPRLVTLPGKTTFWDSGTLRPVYLAADNRDTV